MFTKLIKSDLLPAIAVGIMVAIVTVIAYSLTTSALTTGDIAQDCNNGGLSCQLQVKPAHQYAQSEQLHVVPVGVTSLSQIDTPSDIQPAMGRNMVQRTVNPEHLVPDPVAVVPIR